MAAKMLNSPRFERSRQLRFTGLKGQLARVELRIRIEEERERERGRTLGN